MIVGKISPKHTLEIPAEFRNVFHAGQEVVVTVDKLGRMIVIPIEPICEALTQSFGAWADRADTGLDSQRYVREIRKGSRLDSRD